VLTIRKPFMKSVSGRNPGGPNSSFRNIGSFKGGNGKGSALTGPSSFKGTPRNSGAGAGAGPHHHDMAHVRQASLSNNKVVPF
jgi:hypothetical protein